MLNGIGGTVREWEDELDWLENQQYDGLSCLVCEIALLSFWALLTAVVAHLATAGRVP